MALIRQVSSGRSQLGCVARIRHVASIWFASRVRALQLFAAAAAASRLIKHLTWPELS